MKTGAVEQISDHLKVSFTWFPRFTAHSFQLMTDLQAIMDDHVDTAKESSTKLKQKADLEEKAGKELRDAAMVGLARSEGLIDVSTLDGATAREKQGQRK
jgi:hypothetical protein